ncbi:hypothetical protein BV20DRAFT_937416 [Pilatotrama ljubarskyi]|nr:hypothetical protein BV20DRAFT_937416 [Pilatotrama ljubarskyi]
MASPLSDPQGLPHDIERPPHSAPDVGHKMHEWKPEWAMFPLKGFLGRDYKVIEVVNTWDDEQLLIALKKAYKDLRSWHRRWFSLLSLRYVNDAFIYPQRIGPGRTTVHRNLRLRYLLDHPEYMRGQRDLMCALTKSPEYGVEFVERWNMLRVCLVVVGSALVSLSIALFYGWLTNDWASGFTIASFFSQTFAQIFVLVGCLQYHEF